MQDANVPHGYEDLIRVIHDRYKDMSKSYQIIARYLTQNPNDVAVLSVTALAAKCDVHASRFVRFAQALGCKGFKELQVLFQRRLSTAAPRFDAREAELGAQVDHSEIGFLRDLVARDLTTLQDMLASIDGAQISRVVDLMEQAGTI